MFTVPLTVRVQNPYSYFTVSVSVSVYASLSVYAYVFE